MKKIVLKGLTFIQHMEWIKERIGGDRIRPVHCSNLRWETIRTQTMVVTEWIKKERRIQDILMRCNNKSWWVARAECWRWEKIVNNPKISSLRNWVMSSIALAHWEEASHERKQFSFEHCELEVLVGSSGWPVF